MRHQRWIVLAFVGAALLVGGMAEAASTSLFAQMAWADQRLGPVTTTTLLSVVLGLTTFVGLLRTRRAVTFTDEVIDELSKVTWPSKDETLRATTTVVVTTLLVAGLLGLYDFAWNNLMNRPFWKKLADFILF